MTLNELRNAIAEFERRPPHEACRLTQLFLKAVAASAPTGLAKAIAALDADPSLNMFGLMKAANVGSGTAIRARVYFDDFTVDKRLPDRAVQTLAATFEAIDAPAEEAASEPVIESEPESPGWFDFSGVAASEIPDSDHAATPEPPPVAVEPVPVPPQTAVEPEIIPPAPKAAGKQKLNGAAILPLAEPPPEPAPLAAPPPPIGTRSAERLLRSLLRNRPRSELDVRLAAERADISPRVLQAAAAALGIEENAYGEWRLPSA